MNLYRCTNKISSYYVIAEHPTKAQEMIETLLDEATYGYPDKRKVSEIVLIAGEIEDFNGKPFFSGGDTLIIGAKQ